MNMVPTSYQHLKAGHDRNGYPRRCYVVLAADGRILDTIDEGYGGKPGWLRELVELPEVNVSASEYRAFLAAGAQ